MRAGRVHNLRFYGTETMIDNCAQTVPKPRLKYRKTSKTIELHRNLIQELKCRFS